MNQNLQSFASDAAFIDNEPSPVKIKEEYCKMTK
jgi:hypothetical protein